MRIGIVITNQHHHYHYAAHLATALKQDGTEVDLVSLCELRRNTTPGNAKQVFDKVIKVVPYHVFGKNKELGGHTLGRGFSITRDTIHFFLALYLAPVFLITLRRYKKLVVFNDAAPPYPLMIKIARLFGTKIYLIQEGIRFITPIEQNNIHRLYGTSNNVDHLLVWGPYFKRYFTKIRGGREQNIHVVGSLHTPANYVPQEEMQPSRSVVITTNPIDDVGYCSPHEKYELTKRLVAHLVQYDAEIKIMIKTHPREDAAAYAKLLAEYKQVTVLDKNIPIQKAVMLSSHCLCFASTAGLEALELGRVLGMVKIYKWDYVFNYVEDNGAYPVDLDAPDCRAMLGAFFSASYSKREEAYLEDLYLKTDNVLTNYTEIIQHA